ncbi:MAG: hypothetical protein ACOCSJ_02560 [Candidatus Natronoplasma sp.]
MLDKETVTRQAIYQTKMDQKSESDQKSKMGQKIDTFLECVERAKDYVEDESVRQCFEKVRRLKRYS